MSHINKWSLVSFLVVVGCVTIGGYTLHQQAQLWFEQPPTIWPFLWIIGGCFTLMASQIVSRETSTESTHSHENIPHPPPKKFYICTGFALTLSLIVLIIVPQLNGRSSYAFVTSLWLVACGLTAIAVWLPDEPFRQPIWNTEQFKQTIFFLPQLIFIAILLRLPLLENVPAVLGGDEAAQGLEAIRFLEGNLRNPFSTGWLGVPSMSFMFNSLTIQTWGQTIFALRVPWAIIGVLTVVVVYFLVRRVSGHWVAFGTALLVATYHYHIHYSRLGSNQIADTLFVSLALWFLIRALDGTSQNWLNWYGVGAISGLAFYFYAGARLTPVLVTAILIYTIIQAPRQEWVKHKMGIGVMIFTFLIFSAPIWQYATLFPNEFNARVHQVGIFQSGWLEREVDITEQSVTTILFDQFRRATLAFNYYPDRRVWYGLETPLLDPVSGAIFLLGLGYGTGQLLRKNKDQRVALFVAWWWAGALLGGMLTESPPSSQRLITLSIPTCFFIVLALMRLGELITHTIKPIPAFTFMLIGVLAFSLYSPYIYYFDYTPKTLYGGRHAELATKIAPIINRNNPEADLVFLGAPFMYWQFATIPYLSPNVNGVDIIDPLTQQPEQAWHNRSQGTHFIVLNERLNELDYIKEAFPDGTEYLIYTDAQSRSLLGVLYSLPQIPNHSIDDN